MIVTLDFETYYDDALSLSKMTTSGYVRHPSFEVLLCGAKIDDQPTKVHVGKDNIAAALAAIPWDEATLICHNAMFDAFVLTQVFGHTPAQYADTLSLARAQYPYWAYHNLGACAEKLGFESKIEGVLPKMKGKRLPDLTPEELLTYIGYCARDTDLCYQIHNKLSSGFPDDELRLIDMTIRMFAEPVLLIDAERANKLLKAEVVAKDAAVVSSGVKREDLTSRDKFVAQLKALGIEPPTKVSKTTGRTTWALSKTDAGFRKLLTHPDPRVQALARARPQLSSSLQESRARRFIDESTAGALPVGLRYYAAHTGRWGGANKLNLQNLPRGGELRKSILAPPGYVMVIADLSQIECRVLAWLAEEESLLQMFREGRDPYAEFATEFYGYEVSKDNPDTSTERFVGKTCVLGLGYQMSARKLQFSLEVAKPPVQLDMETCIGLVDLYRGRFRNIPRLWRRADTVIASMAYGQPVALGPLETSRWMTWLPNGMALQYWDLVASVENDRLRGARYRNERGQMFDMYGGKWVENTVQALARIVMSEAMLRIDEELPIVMTTHDEVVVLAKEEDAEDATKFVHGEMVKVPEWCPGLPLACDVGYDTRYSK